MKYLPTFGLEGVVVLCLAEGLYLDSWNRISVSSWKWGKAEASEYLALPRRPSNVSVRVVMLKAGTRQVTNVP
jgi:hypothetical protein